ncbi:MAG: TraR/DksA C4-type zinc finger protein [Rikenellaceae bacterium]
MVEDVKRYSDADLAEFKELILKKIENARADYELLRATITHTADNDTEDTSPTFKVLEEGATTLSKEESARLAAHQMKFLRNLELALVRIENKTYGICKTTGTLIPKARLLRVPHATECIEAKEGRK